MFQKFGVEIYLEIYMRFLYFMVSVLFQVLYKKSKSVSRKIEEMQYSMSLLQKIWKMQGKRFRKMSPKTWSWSNCSLYKVWYKQKKDFIVLLFCFYRFLQGACIDTKCSLSHNVSAEKMPTCKFYLEGACSKDSCPYLHVRISPKADICKDFLEGFCKKASEVIFLYFFFFVTSSHPSE